MMYLVEQYVVAGFYLDSTELPDFVPVFLEFASCIDPDAERDMLAQPAHVFAVLAERLDQSETPYAAIFHELAALAGGKIDSEALPEIQERQPHQDSTPTDKEVQEAHAPPQPAP